MRSLNGKINRIAIANRGEVAVRIIRACDEMGIEAQSSFDNFSAAKIPCTS